MTQDNKKAVRALLETVAATGDVGVMREARKELEAIIKAEATENAPRRPVIVPDASQYTFKQGEQVAILSANGKIRTHYEYLERTGKFDKVMDVKDGKTHRVWLNKLLPIAVASRMVKEKEARQKLADKQAEQATKQAKAK